MKLFCVSLIALAAAIQTSYVKSVASTPSELWFGIGINVLCASMIIAGMAFDPDCHWGARKQETRP